MGQVDDKLGLTTSHARTGHLVHLVLSLKRWQQSCSNTQALQEIYCYYNLNSIYEKRVSFTKVFIFQKRTIFCLKAILVLKDGVTGIEELMLTIAIIRCQISKLIIKFHLLSLQKHLILSNNKFQPY